MKKLSLICFVIALSSTRLCSADDSALQDCPAPTYRIIDLFAGIGGIRLGFEKTHRCSCVFTSEWDKECQKTYSANWPNETIYGDISPFVKW